MGRKHNDVFVLGEESLEESPDAPSTPATEDAPIGHSKRPRLRGLGHRPLARRPSADGANPAAKLIGRPANPARQRRPAVFALTAGVALAVVAVIGARLLAVSGGAGAPPTSPAASEIAAVPPPSPAVQPSPVVPDQRSISPRSSDAEPRRAKHGPPSGSPPPIADPPHSVPPSPPLHLSGGGSGGRESFGFEGG